MPGFAGEFMKLRTFTAASREINNWINGSEAFALLTSALDAGILNALRPSRTVRQVAAATGLDEKRLENVLNALENHGLIERSSDAFRPAPVLESMMKDDAVQSLAPVLQAARARLANLQNISGTVADYNCLSNDEVLSMAQGIGMSSLSPVRRSIGALIGESLPEMKKLWRAGAHHLELGCGVGNTLFQILTAFPGTTGVGIEIDPATATEARRRAAVLGISHRVEVRNMNAIDLKEAGLYDTAHWSQFFFPEPCRPAVLSALFSALRPGGYVCMPVLAAVSGSIGAYRLSMLLMALRCLVSTPSLCIPYLNGVLTSSRAQERAEKRLASLQKLIYEMWGIPIKTAGALQAEVESSGFRTVRAVPVLISQYSESRGWLLAQRP